MALLWLSFGFISALTADSSCSKPLVDCRQEKSILVHQIHSLLGQSTSPFMLYQGVTDEKISKAHQSLEELAKSFSEWYLSISNDLA